MLQLHGDYDGSSFFEKEDICHLAMQLFNGTGHTFNSRAIFPNRKIEDLIYLDLDHSYILTWDELDLLRYIKNASMLFINKNEYFGIGNCGDGIAYFALSLYPLKYVRTEIAPDIHNLLSKIIPCKFSVVLFEMDGSFLLSFAESFRNNTVGVSVSEWIFKYDDEGEVDWIRGLDAAQFTSKSPNDFFRDLVEVMVNHSNSGPSFSSYYDTENDFFYQYKFNVRTKPIHYKSLALDLFELELEISEQSENEAQYYDELEDIDDYDGDDVEEINDDETDIDEIDREIFKDPVELLKYLDKEIGR